jgi:hypothetical protein
MWYFLNETRDGPVFRRAVAVLPKVRTLDSSRVCLLNSGRWDYNRGGNPINKKIGSLSNPGSNTWDAVNLRDEHTYLRAPHNAGEIRKLRGGGSQDPLFFSEYGIGSALDLTRLNGDFERLGATDAMDAKYYRGMLDRFMTDWDLLKLGEIFGRPEDYFRNCQLLGAGYRTLGLNALRSDPKLVAHSMTGLFDHVGSGEGPITMFRDIKPGFVDALRDGFAPLRWCLFVEPYQLYRGGTVRVEAVLANEDVLRSGDYEVEVLVLDPNQKAVFKKKVKVNIPDSKTNPSFVVPVLAENVQINGPAGRYRLAAHFVSGAVGAGQSVEFYVADPVAMPPVKADIAIWGKDSVVETWLKEHGIASHPLIDGVPTKREVIIAVGKARWDAEVFADMARRIARGGTVIFLSPQTMFDDALTSDKSGLHWLPLIRKGYASKLDNLRGLYHRDDWARHHPIFDGLPCGGLMDWTFYRSIVPRDGLALMGLDQPTEAVCGGINTCSRYGSGIYIGIYKLGDGSFIANVLNIRDNLGSDPVAERLLRNMLNYAASDLDKPLAKLPVDFEEQLKKMPPPPSKTNVK